ncbi:MAG TPA: hypothetical protein ENI05_08905 [Porticoccus sp.]|nr:hypothetical protein [Porticoccus sp.]
MSQDRMTDTPAYPIQHDGSLGLVWELTEQPYEVRRGMFYFRIKMGTDCEVWHKGLLHSCPFSPHKKGSEVGQKGQALYRITGEVSLMRMSEVLKSDNKEANLFLGFLGEHYEDDKANPWLCVAPASMVTSEVTG